MRLDDPSLVRDEYADEDLLRRRSAIFTGRAAGVDVHALVAREVAGAGRVLEVGCGWGELAERIAGVGAEVVATDLSPRMVELARERGLDARVADVQALPFADASFDAAVAAWMLYHVPEIDRALSELARVLRPGGRLVAVTNSGWHLQELRELVGSGPSPSRFTSENAEEILLRRFASVRREDVRRTVEFATRAEVLDYLHASMSMRAFAANLPERITEPFGALTHITVLVAERP